MGKATEKPDTRTVAGRIAYVVDATGCPSDAAFARWIKAKSAQRVSQWKKRNSLPRDPAVDISRATGADTHWLITGEGKPFPNGVKTYPGEGAQASRAFAHRIEGDVDQLRYAVTALYEWLGWRLPGAAAELREGLSAMVPPQYAERGFHAVLLRVLDTAEQEVEGAAGPVQSLAKTESARRAGEASS